MTWIRIKCGSRIRSRILIRIKIKWALSTAENIQKQKQVIFLTGSKVKTFALDTSWVVIH